VSSLVTKARKATYTAKNVCRSFEVTGIWPFNRRRVFNSKSREITHFHGAPSPTPITATPRHSRAVYRIQRDAIQLLSSNSPRSLSIKNVINRLGKAALGAFADTALQAEMVREVRADAKRPSIKAVQDRRQLTKARVIDQNDVIRLREEREGRDAQKQARIPRSRQQPSTVSSSSTVPVTPSKRSQKRVRISKKVTVNLVDPENAFLEDGWDTDREIEAEKEASEEEFIDIEDILALPTPTARGKNGKDVDSRPPVITRSGRVVKVVDKDNL
jgi:hypothetical protein